MSISVEKVLSGEYRHIWIYGAGKAGKKLVQAFNFLHIAFEGITVSKYDGTVLPGVTITELSKVETEITDTVFLITTSSVFHQEIIENIKARGYIKYIIWDRHCLNELWKKADYAFIDRKRGCSKCCFILAGYKEFLWDSIFERFEKYIPEDVDVCIISSGVYNKKLSDIAEKNLWSYLSTKINSVTLVQNVAFAIYEDCDWVYKVDEDIFITEDSFEKMYLNYKKISKYGNFVPGIVAPLIPVNGYGYSIILNKLGLSEQYEESFGTIKVGGNPDSEIEKNPEAAVFMWTKCPQIDVLNRIFERIDNSGSMTSLCGVRFSIGFILMEHSLWDNMQGFTVSGNADMGTDEEELCAECIIRSKAIMMSLDTVAGHFAFKHQTDRMKEVYTEDKEWFDIK